MDKKSIAIIGTGDGPMKALSVEIAKTLANRKHINDAPQSIEEQLFIAGRSTQKSELMFNQILEKLEKGITMEYSKVEGQPLSTIEKLDPTDKKAIKLFLVASKHKLNSNWKQMFWIYDIVGNEMISQDKKCKIVIEFNTDKLETHLYLEKEWHEKLKAEKAEEEKRMRDYGNGISGGYGLGRSSSLLLSLMLGAAAMGPGMPDYIPSLDSMGSKRMGGKKSRKKW